MGTTESKPKNGKKVLTLAKSDSSGMGSNTLKDNIMWQHYRRTSILSNDYETVRVLGEGSMGTISCVKKRYEGSHSYACKAIPLSRLSNPKYLDVLRNEIAIMKTLDHPNILRAIETFETKKQIHIVMEFCSGGDLYMRTPYSEANAVLILKKIISALSYMHSKNIIHRDIKYENIMFDGKGPEADIKLIDFGLAKKFLPGEILQARAGSMYTMAPEVFDRSGYTAKADMYSLGVVAYMMLSNECPFVTPHYVKNCPYDYDEPRWDSVSEDAKGFVKSLVLKDADARMSAVEAAKVPWLTRTTGSQPGVRSPLKVPIQKLTEDFATYSRYNELTKIALMLIVRRWSLENIHDLNDTFRLYDKNNDGVLSGEEFCDALRSGGYEDEEVSQFFKSMDFPTSGEIPYTDFVAAAVATHDSISVDMIADAFKRLDSDHAGFITKENLKDLLGDEGTDEKMEQIMAEVNKGTDDKISYDEFLLLFRRNKKT